MKPTNLKTKIFLDSGNPDETRETMKLTGFLDGQTTNPSLVAKHPELQKKKEAGQGISDKELLNFYKGIVSDISGQIPGGSVSIEVYADDSTTADKMFAQGKEFFNWIPNAHIKYPTTAAGLEAASRSIAEGMRVNMTLVFSQAQAAAVHLATKGAKKGDVFLSPFIGRLDDIGQNGMSFIANVSKMYKEIDSHVEVLAASFREKAHVQEAFRLGVDIATIPYKLLKLWGEHDMPVVGESFVYDKGKLTDLPYEKINLAADWKSFDISHDLTAKGITKFAADWNSLIA